MAAFSLTKPGGLRVSGDSSEITDLAQSHRRSMRRAIFLAATLMVAGFVSLAIDIPMARFCVVEDEVPTGPRLHGDVRELLGVCEGLGHGFGILLIALTVSVLDPPNRRKIPRLLVCGLGAGGIANALKILVISRMRPRALDFQEFGGGVLDTFERWLPLINTENVDKVFDSAKLGCPSAHAATGAGLAVVLAWMYPNGRWLFAMFAVLTAAQRVASQAHFVSDTLWGAAVGCVFASTFIYMQWPATAFNKFEGRAAGGVSEG